MQLSSDQVVDLFNKYLREHVVPGNPNIMEEYLPRNGGHVLKRRLWLILRDKRYENLVKGDRVEILELFRLGREYLKKYKKVYIYGMDHWFSETDMDVLEKIYRKNFID